MSPLLSRRSRTLVALALSCLLTSFHVHAQKPVKPLRIGFVTPVPQTSREKVFHEELRRLGYVEGRDVVIEYRSAEGKFERLPELVAELVGLKVDVIVARATQAALAGKRATSTIPIVMIGVDDPVKAGLVASLAQPGGNVTGTALLAADVVGKQFQLLREFVPKLSRVSVVWNSANPVFQKRQVAEAQAVAANLGLQLDLVEASSAEQLDRGFAAMGKQRSQAVLVLADVLFGTHAGRIAALASKHRLPTIYGAREFADAGGLVAYGPSYAEAYRVAATFVDRIRKGERPANLPIDQTSKFDLVVNARTAKMLGVAIPQSVRLRADLVID